MVQDKLQLNDAKTEFLIIGTRAQLNKVTINDLQVGEVKVSAVHSVRNLGAWFDTNMNMTTLINSICQSIHYHLHNIRCIRKYLSYDNRMSIVQAIIMSRLDYCNGLLCPLFILASCNACRTRQLGWYVLHPGMIISHHH